MRLSTRKEIEYLAAAYGSTPEDKKLVGEMRQRLDALRRLDQNFSAADWQPPSCSTGWHPESPIHPF